jgi:KUP system potassium uptake protein
MEGDDDRIEESSVRLVGSSNDGIVDGGGGGVGESRWVDGSEVDSESPPWSLLDENDSGQGYGSMRRRLVKKPKSVDSFDVEAMEIAGAHHHHSKVLIIKLSSPFTNYNFFNGYHTFPSMYIRACEVVNWGKML